MVRRSKPEVLASHKPPGGGSAAAEILRLLRVAHVSARSGHLHLVGKREHRGLAVHEGQVVEGRSDVPGEHLGDVLVRHGLLSRAQVEAAVATVLAERRPLGAVLLGLSIVDRECLEEAIGWHVREILFAALERTSGSPSFEELSGVPGGAEGSLASRLPTGQLLLDAARTLRDPGVVREALGDLDLKVALPADPRLRAQALALTPADGFILSRIDGTLSVRELADLGPLPPEETERSLLALLCAGAVVPASDRSTPRRAAPPSPPPPRRERPPVSPASRPAPAVSSAVDEDAADTAGSSPSPPSRPAEVRRLILETYGSLPQRDHFELLGVSLEASPPEVRAGYARLVRWLHPDACRDPLLADIDAQREAVFLQVRRAYEILRDPESRAAYERSVSRRRPRPAPRVGPAAAPHPATVPSTPPVSTSPPSAERPAETAPSPLSLDERLAETIAKGEQFLRNGHYWEAIRQIEPTLQHAQGELRIRARLALAKACLRNPKWGRRAEAHLQDVVREDPSRIEAYLLLGDVYRDGGLQTRAVAMYHRVLELQPHHRLARRQLALLEGEEPPKREGGLRGLLRKR